MSDDRENDVRPAKRARLDDSAAHTPAAATPQATPGSALNAPSQIETDYEREVRAGITEYICPENLGFTGVLKQRYTDFLVNEIGLDGQVLHLKSTHVEKRKKDVKAEAPVETERVRPEEKIDIVEDSAAPVTPKEEKPAEPEQPAKVAEANDGEETFAIAAAPKKEAKAEVCPTHTLSCGPILTIDSSQTRIQSCSTRSLVKTHQSRSWRLYRVYGTAKMQKLEASKR